MDISRPSDRRADFSEFQTSQTLSFPRGTTQGRKAVVCVGPKKFADSERPQVHWGDSEGPSL